MIEPKCLKDDNFYGHCADGFILPCCWIDQVKYDLVPELLQDKFNLSNVESIEKILNSEEWVNFRKKISQNPFSFCEKYCGKNI